MSSDQTPDLDLTALLNNTTHTQRDELRSALRRMDQCESIVRCGKGHQSKAKCDNHYEHALDGDEHYSSDGMEWSGAVGRNDDGWWS